MRKTVEHRLGELFCGPGGIALGANMASASGGDGKHVITHAWASDYDPDACDTYRLNICPSSPLTVLCEDVRKLDFERLRQISEIDALAFGFPCNDYSMVGERKGLDGSFGSLFTYGVEALKLFKPRWFLAENVGGLRNANAGRAFDLILEDLEGAGYRLTPHLYKFERYGIPQARHRIIIVGIRNDLQVKFQVPSTTPYLALDNTCRKALETPPIPPDAPNQEKTRQSPEVVRRLRHIKPGENAFNANIPTELKLNVRGARISQIYKRLDPNKPSYTITGSGGGGTHVYHWSEPRALTNRERARLQSFPDTYGFCGSKEKVRKQIGMAVPPMGVKIVLEAILKSFAGVEYEDSEQNIYLQDRLLDGHAHYVVDKK